MSAVLREDTLATNNLAGENVAVAGRALADIATRVMHDLPTHCTKTSRVHGSHTVYTWSEQGLAARRQKAAEVLARYDAKSMETAGFRVRLCGRCGMWRFSVCGCQVHAREGEEGEGGEEGRGAEGVEGAEDVQPALEQ